MQNALFCPEKPGPLGRLLARRLRLGVLCQKIQIPSTKLQTNLKFKYSMTKTFQDDIVWVFEFRSLGFACPVK